MLDQDESSEENEEVIDNEDEMSSAAETRSDPDVAVNVDEVIERSYSEDEVHISLLKKSIVKGKRKDSISISHDKPMPKRINVYVVPKKKRKSQVVRMWSVMSLTVRLT